MGAPTREAFTGSESVPTAGVTDPVGQPATGDLKGPWSKPAAATKGAPSSDTEPTSGPGSEPLGSPGSGWIADRPLPTLGGFPSWASIATGPNDVLHAAWHDLGGADTGLLQVTPPSVD